MKILNLYSGIGGNRRLWGNEHEITAVEMDKDIAKIYSHFFPDDNVVIGDVHEYLKEHFAEYDFIWASPPCPSHSRMRLFIVRTENIKPIYPDMKLYEEIIFLKYYFKGRYCVENVKSYYEPLIKPHESGRHYYWANFVLPKFRQKGELIRNEYSIEEKQKAKGFDLSMFHNVDKKKILNNCVDSNEAKEILDCAMMNKQKVLE